MADFDYSAIDSFGEAQEGRLSAENLLEASKILKERKWVIKNLNEAKPEVSLISYLNPTSYFLTSRDLGLSFAQLAALLSAGINLLAALKTLSIISLKSSSRELWRNTHLSVQAGKSLSEALADHPSLKNSLYVNLIKIGEETGELDRILLILAQGLERNRAIKSKITGALLYPCFVFIIAAIAGAIAVFYLIPKLQILIAAMGRKIHPLTQILVDIAQNIEKYSLQGLLLFAFFIIIFITAYLNPRGRMKIDKNMLKIPVIGIMLRTFYSAEFARNFALLIKSGIKLTDALSQCSNALRNRHLTNILKKARTNIINGAPLTETISTPNAFSPMLLSMINIGEKTGSLDTLLDEQANYHYELLDKYINRFSAIISFLMIVLVAGTLAFIFAAILLTYFS